jgi:hypothetical protein
MGAPAPETSGAFAFPKKAWCQMASTPSSGNEALKFVVQYDRDILQAEELWEQLPSETPTDAHRAMAISVRRNRLREVLELQKANVHKVVEPGKCSCGLAARTYSEEPVTDEILAALDGHVNHREGRLVGRPIAHVALELTTPDPFAGGGETKLGYFSMICAVTGNKRQTGETEWNVFCYECHNVVGVGQLKADYRLKLLNKCHASFHIHYPRSEWDW